MLQRQPPHMKVVRFLTGAPLPPSSLPGSGTPTFHSFAVCPVGSTSGPYPRCTASPPPIPAPTLGCFCPFSPPRLCPCARPLFSRQASGPGRAHVLTCSTSASPCSSSFMAWPYRYLPFSLPPQIWASGSPVFPSTCSRFPTVAQLYPSRLRVPVLSPLPCMLAEVGGAYHGIRHVTAGLPFMNTCLLRPGLPCSV